jgi:hypothetical protein
MIEFPSLFRGQDEPEENSGYSDDLGDGGSIGSSMGDITYEYDKASGSYEVNIIFDRGGSANYSLDADTVLELDANGGAFYNSSIRGQM